MLYILLGAYHKNICNLECVQQSVTKMFKDFKFCYARITKVRLVQAGVKYNKLLGRWGWNSDFGTHYY